MKLSNQVTSYLPNNHNDRGSNPKPQKGKLWIRQKRHNLVVGVVRNIRVNVLLGHSFYGCGTGGHMFKDCPNVRI